MCTSALVVLSLLAQIAPPADPQAKSQAQGLLNAGWTLYEKGDHAGALEKFNAAYAAYPSPKLLFNIGQADGRLAAVWAHLTGTAGIGPGFMPRVQSAVTDQEFHAALCHDCAAKIRRWQG